MDADPGGEAFDIDVLPAGDAAPDPAAAGVLAGQGGALSPVKLLRRGHILGHRLRYSERRRVMV